MVHLESATKGACKFHRKAPVLESFFNKLTGLRLATSLKKTPTQMFSGEICEDFKNPYFEEHLQMAASIY